MSALSIHKRQLAEVDPKRVAWSPTLHDETSHILLVEDNPYLSESLTNLLRDSGYIVDCVSTGYEALSTVRRRPPDLILLDLHLPDMTGHMVCSLLKSDEQTRLIPIVIITASDERSAQLQSISAGAEGYLQKPIDMEELDARVEVLLRTKRRNDTLESAENVIFALANAVEAKDSYTQGHLQRLGTYATAIGERLGLNGTALMALRYGALLHDVGKVGIDEAIIRKQGPLTPNEYRIMQQHTLIGEHIVAPLRLAASVGPIVRGHHERWDGRGYPDGLVGDDIPLGARIVAAADAYDAMTTQRPYNRVCSKEEAIKRLRAGAGMYWDPRVIKVFIEYLETTDLLTNELPLQLKERTVG